MRCSRYFSLKCREGLPFNVLPGTKLDVKPTTTSMFVPVLWDVFAIGNHAFHRHDFRVPTEPQPAVKLMPIPQYLVVMELVLENGP